MSTRLLWRTGWRHLVRHPLQSALAVLGIALGVAVVTGVDLARESARRGFLLSAEAVTGRATHQVVGGPGGLADSLYRVVRVDLGLRLSAPIVEGWVRTLPPRAAGQGAPSSEPGTPSAGPGAASAGPAEVAVPATTRTLRVLGVDPFAEAPFRSYVTPRRSTGADAPPTESADTRDAFTSGSGWGADIGTLLVVPGSAVLAAATAVELGLAPGDTFSVDVGGSARTVVLAGTLDPADDLTRRAIAELLLMDIAAAQELLGRSTIDRIDVRLDDGADAAALAAALPPGVRVLETGARTSATAGMTRAFEVNLTALGLVALVFGMFLIYNAMTFSVVQRRELIGLLRAQGVTRAEVFRLIISEAVLIGVVATAIGMALGLLLGRGLVTLVTRTINDLYYTVTVTDVRPGAWLLAKGVLLGIGATVLATLPPAREATRTTPRAALLRSMVESGAQTGVRRAASLSLPVAAVGVLLLVASGRNLTASFTALFLLILAGALIAPFGTVLMARLAQPLATRGFGTIGRMATRGVAATLSRTGPAVAALSVAIAVGIAMGLLIGSFRTAVATWLGQTLVADVYVSSPAATNDRVDAALDPDLVARIRTTPGVAGISTYRNARLPLADGDLRVVAVDLFDAHRDAFRLLDGSRTTAWPLFTSGGVLISEPLAYRRRLAAGDSITLPTDRGDVAFPVAGVFRDYASEHGVLFLDRRAWDRFFDDDAVGSVAVFAADPAATDDLLARLRRIETDGVVRFQSNRALREGSLRVFDRTFAITVVLRALALVVAFVGVLGALMALQLERAREIGILRATGLTPRQLAALVTAQTGLLGLSAGVLAIPLGLGLAWTMIHVVNRRSFGWTLDMRVDVGVIVASVALAVLAALLAGVWPAWRMGRMAVAEVVRGD